MVSARSTAIAPATGSLNSLQAITSAVAFRPALLSSGNRREVPASGGLDISTSGEVHMAQQDFLGFEVEIVAFRLDLHRVDDCLLEHFRLTRVGANDMT